MAIEIGKRDMDRNGGWVPCLLDPQDVDDVRDVLRHLWGHPIVFTPPCLLLGDLDAVDRVLLHPCNPTAVGVRWVHTALAMGLVRHAYSKCAQHLGARRGECHQQDHEKYIKEVLVSGLLL